MKNNRRFLRYVAFAASISVVLLSAPLAIRWYWDWQRKDECKSHLKLIGEGLYNYHASFDTFPAGTVPYDLLPPEKRLSWLVEIAPFFEGNNPVSRIDKTKSWDSEENITVCKAISFSLYRCPSSSMQSIQGMGTTNYVGVAGLGKDAASLPKDDPRDGVFGYDRRVSLTDIKDGTSNTMMVIETSLDIGPWSAGGRTTVRGLDSSQQPYIGKGYQFGGLHADGCLVLFADGSVHFIKGSIDPKLFESLSTIAGGERVR